MTSCAFHPGRIERLFYCYPWPPKMALPWIGEMLCEECKVAYDAQNWGYFEPRKEKR
jgi:hypothetical protein